MNYVIRNSSWFKSGKKHPQFGKPNYWGKHTEETKNKISNAMKGRKAWNKGIPNSTNKYWLGKTNKDIKIIHHIDGNHKNNSIDNLMIMTHSRHRSLHFRGYEYLTSIGLISDYLKDFILKYEVNTKCMDGKIVHHIDCNRSNSSQTNLLYVQDRKIHNKLHQEAYLYLVKINKITEYIEWFLSIGEIKTTNNSLTMEVRK